MDKIKTAKEYFDEGYNYDEQGEYDKAIESYTKAIELNPDHFKTYFNRGIAYSKMGERKKATDDFEIAKKLNPDDE